MEPPTSPRSGDPADEEDDSFVNTLNEFIGNYPDWNANDDAFFNDVTYELPKKPGEVSPRSRFLAQPPDLQQPLDPVPDDDDLVSVPRFEVVRRPSTSASSSSSELMTLRRRSTSSSSSTEARRSSVKLARSSVTPLRRTSTMMSRKDLPQHSLKKRRRLVSEDEDDDDDDDDDDTDEVDEMPVPRKPVPIAKKQPRYPPRKRRPPASLEIIGENDPNPSDYNFVQSTTRYLTDSSDVDFIAKQVVHTRFLRFVKAVIVDSLKIYKEEVRSRKRITISTAATQSLKFFAIDHLYSMLRTFCFIYKSFKESSLIAGSFLPDYMQMLDLHYDDYEAAKFCTAKGTELDRVTKRKHQPRKERGLIWREDSSPAIRAANRKKEFFVEDLSHVKRGTSGERDLSCVLLSEKHVLSNKVFAALKIRLNQYVRNASRQQVDFKFSKQFAIEVNQAFVYFTSQALRTAIVVASGRNNFNDSYRVNEHDIAYAFSIMPPPYGQLQGPPFRQQPRKRK